MQPITFFLLHLRNSISSLFCSNDMKKNMNFFPEYYKKKKEEIELKKCCKYIIWRNIKKEKKIIYWFSRFKSSKNKKKSYKTFESFFLQFIMKNEALTKPQYSLLSISSQCAASELYSSNILRIKYRNQIFLLIFPLWGKKAYYFAKLKKLSIIYVLQISVICVWERLWVILCVYIAPRHTCLLEHFYLFSITISKREKSKIIYLF